MMGCEVYYFGVEDVKNGSVLFECGNEGMRVWEKKELEGISTEWKARKSKQHG